MKIRGLILSSGCEADQAPAVFIFGHGIPNRHNKSYSGIQNLLWYSQGTAWP
jgi:hypothetical protein